MSLLFRLAHEFYDLSLREVEERLVRLPNWPRGRPVERVLSVQEASVRLAGPALRALVMARAVAIVESRGRLYPIRIPDVMMGVDTSSLAEEAKRQLPKSRDDIVLRGPGGDEILN